LLTCVAWVFFRARTIADAVAYLKRVITDRNFAWQYLDNERYNYELLLLIGIFVVIEWNNRTRVEPLSGNRNLLRLAMAIVAILAFGTFSDYKEFIYFQF
jgi:alginate O-acetyltransferase complex protein AlgI